MLQMTVGDLKAQFSMVLQQIKAGNDVEILYGRSKTPVARITGVEKKRRVLGTYKGTFTEVGDGKITLEEFLGVNSLDEVEPLI